MKVLKVLIENELVDINSEDKDGRTALYWRCATGE
jgi:ankyrin repeat protein